MPDKRISAFDSAGPITATDIIPILQGGTNKKALLGALQVFFYADSPWKSPVFVATTAALPANTVSGASQILTANSNGAFASTIDGTGPISINAEILVANEATQSKNGIYVLTNTGSASTPWVLTRRGDANNGARLKGAVVFVDAGTTKGAKIYKQITNGIGIGSSNVIWQELVKESAEITDSASLTALRTNSNWPDPADTDNRYHWKYNTASTAITGALNDYCFIKDSLTGADYKVTILAISGVKTPTRTLTKSF